MEIRRVKIRESLRKMNKFEFESKLDLMPLVLFRLGKRKISII